MSYRNLCVPAAFLVFAFTACWAATGVQLWESPHLSADPKDLYAAAAQANPPADTDVLVINDEAGYVFDEQGKVTATHYLVYKVLTQRGAEGWDSVAISWEPWHEERPVIRARVITEGNVVHELDPKTINDAPTRDTEEKTYSDGRMLRAPLPAIAPGSLVEEEVVTRETPIFAGAGITGRYYFGRSVPVQHSRLTLDAPSSLPLRYELALLDQLQPQRKEEGGRIKVTFEQGPLAALEDGPSNLPSNVAAFPQVNFSTADSWQVVAREYGKIVDGRIAGAEVKALVDKLVAGKASAQEKAQAILQYLDREVRYTGIEFSEAAIVPHTPSETLTRKYGDCKDKATLLVSMLRAANIPAYVALLRAGERHDLPPELPGAGWFDHAIVYLPGPPELWIDATDEYARLGQFPLADQGRLALIARPETTALRQTLVSTASDNLLLERREIVLSEYGQARVTEISEPHGSLESEYRSTYADKHGKYTTENLTEYVKSQYLAEKLDGIDRSDPTDFSRQFQLTLEMNRSKRGFTDIDNAGAAIRRESLFARLPGQLQQKEQDEKKDDAGKAKKKRTSDYQIAAPFVTEWRYRIVPPAGFQPKQLPQNSNIALGPASLTEKYSAGPDNVVEAVLRFEIGKTRLTVAEADEMRKHIGEIRAGEAILISFEPAAQALVHQGKVREGFQAYRKMIATHPDRAVHHLRMAKALLDAGMGEAAREEARTAVKLQPESAMAQKILAEILEYDLVGRKFRPGSDYAGAEAAFRAARKLDPEDNEAAGNLAILLEYNHEGMRYGKGADMKKAVAEYRALGSEKLNAIGLSNNLAFALFYAGEFAEARNTAETLNPQPNALIVACEAVGHGSKAALEEANKRSSSPAALQEMVGTAAEMLLNMRHYPEAADLFEASATGERASARMGLASALRKARPREELKFGDDPSGVVLQMVRSIMNLKVNEAEVLPLYSRNARIVDEKTDREEREKAYHVGRSVWHLLSQKGISPDATLDVMFQSMEPKVEGDDRPGYRVTTQVPGGKTMIMFVVREDGKYKLLDSTDKPDALGLEVLDRIEAHNLDGARVLLDWLREEQHLSGGDDPLAGLAFPRIWTKGKDADEAHMKLAAGAILVQQRPTAARGVAVLEDLRSAFTTDTDKLNLALALIEGYSETDNYEKELAISSELTKQYPESASVFLTADFALRAQGRFAEAEDLALGRLKRLPSDVDALHARSWNAVVRGDYAAARNLRLEIIKTGKPSSEDFNSVAWYSLYTTVTDADIEYAAKAAQMSQNNASILHTLGCVYASSGKAKEAREVLVHAMDVLGLDEPDSNYWYAFGLIAEQYGEREVAISDYARVTKPPKPIQIPGSSYKLATLRQETLRSSAQMLSPTPATAR